MKTLIKNGDTPQSLELINHIKFFKMNFFKNTFIFFIFLLLLSTACNTQQKQVSKEVIGKPSCNMSNYTNQQGRGYSRKDCDGKRSRNKMDPHNAKKQGWKSWADPNGICQCSRL